MWNCLPQHITLTFWLSVFRACLKTHLFFCPHCDLDYFLLFWHAPLGVRSAIRRHQPPQRAILSHIDCFVQCKVVGCRVSLDDVQPHDTGTPWWSLPVLCRGSRYDQLGICIIIHTCNVPKYGEMLWLDYRCKVTLLGYSPHLLVANKLVPFDSKQCSQAPLTIWSFWTL